MGDKPVFSCRCHVFKIDPNTKKTWNPASDGSIQVSFFFDPSKKAYRIVSIENDKLVINSTVVAGMTFSRTAQKFGQWSDQRANTVYGVGFSNEDDLSKFADQFNDAKVCVTRDALSPVGAPPPVDQESLQHISSLDYPSESQFNSVNEAEPVKLSISNDDNVDQSRICGQSVDDAMVGLTLENDRLRASLCHSRSNLKKWEVELHTLRTNNSRLQSALHENSRNIEEWKTQLLQYREENTKLRARNEELETEIDNLGHLKNGNQSPKTVRKQSKSTLKNEEIERVKHILEKVTAELVEVKEENTLLNTQLRQLEEKSGVTKQFYENSMVCQIQADMELRLRELVDINRKLLTYCRRS